VGKVVAAILAKHEVELRGQVLDPAEQSRPAWLGSQNAETQNPGFGKFGIG
jgi:hypothetical protein